MDKWGTALCLVAVVRLTWKNLVWETLVQESFNSFSSHPQPEARWPMCGSVGQSCWFLIWCWHRLPFGDPGCVWQATRASVAVWSRCPRLAWWFPSSQRLPSHILAFPRPTQCSARLSLHNLASHTCLHSSRARYSSRCTSRADKAPRRDVRLQHKLEATLLKLDISTAGTATRAWAVLGQEVTAVAAQFSTVAWLFRWPSCLRRAPTAAPTTARPLSHHQPSPRHSLRDCVHLPKSLPFLTCRLIFLFFIKKQGSHEENT